MGMDKCANAADAYTESTIYALGQLDFENVAVYLDAAHAGWLGWPDNLEPTAAVYGDIYKEAGSPKAVRGLVTNVSNYNPVRPPVSFPSLLRFLSHPPGQGQS